MKPRFYMVLCGFSGGTAESAKDVCNLGKDNLLDTQEGKPAALFSSRAAARNAIRRTKRVVNCPFKIVRLELAR